jgi:hypothetical protein
MRSFSTDSYPNTVTITFYGATYISTYLSLTAKEIFSNPEVLPGLNGRY